MTTRIIDAPCGRLEGLNDAGILAFKGIPFATAARWRPAEPVRPWSGTHTAQAPGNIAPQNPNALDDFIGRTATALGEDCLNLNVFTQGTDGSVRPVMVWIHGGAFVTGSGCFKIFDGAALASRGAVVVTINYRLGALGFCRLNGATGTEGIGDQIMALRWVRENIRSFGGDPGNVTIFGESAGAMSVACLMASPEARGLFHKAVLQSGAGHIARPQDHGERVAHAFLKHLDIAAGDTVALLQAPVSALLKAQAAVIADIDDQGDPHALGTMPFQPVYGDARLPFRPVDAIRQGSAGGVPVLCGTTSEEWKLWTALDAKLHQMDEAKLQHWASKKFQEDATALLAAHPHGSPYDRLVAMQTQRAFREPANRLNAAQAAHAPVYDYVFDWRSPAFNGMFGACHGLELGFVFGTHGLPKADQFFGSGPDAARLASAMMDAWVAFARSGAPTADAVQDWPRWAGDAPRSMIFGAGESPGHVAAATVLPAWSALPDKVVGP